MDIKPRPIIAGKVILITGASSGIGETTAREFAQAGGRVILAARRADRLEKLSNEINEAGGTALAIPTDLTDPEQITHLVQTSLSMFNRIDVLANIAGISYSTWFEKLTPEKLHEMFEVNVLGMAELTRQIIPVMKAQHEGHIINISSYASRVAIPSLVAYSSTKYAVDGLTEGLRRELLPWGIEVSNVHPSSVSDTGIKIGGFHVTSLPILTVSRRQVARVIVSLVESPRRSIYIGNIYEAPVYVLRRFPDLADSLSNLWVRWRQRSELPSEIQSAVYPKPMSTRLAFTAAGFLMGLLAVGKLLSKK
jgi:NADP-dependent 3-hydroxy acid dehydrogenase YdfG